MHGSHLRGESTSGATVYGGILIIRGGDPAIEGHSALPIGSEAETNRRLSEAYRHGCL